MNEKQFRELLANYIAGELDPQQAADFRAALQADEQRRKLVQELQAAAAVLEAGTISQEEAERRTAMLALDPSHAGVLSPHGRRPERKRLFAVLRYAAVILVAFGAGFLARAWPAVDRTEPTRPAVQATPINEVYVASFTKASESFPHASTFSRSLLALARK